MCCLVVIRMYKQGQGNCSSALAIKTTAAARLVTFHEEKWRQPHSVVIKLKEFM